MWPGAGTMKGGIILGERMITAEEMAARVRAGMRSENLYGVMSVMVAPRRSEVLGMAHFLLKHKEEYAGYCDFLQKQGFEFVHARRLVLPLQESEGVFWRRVFEALVHKHEVMLNGTLYAPRLSDICDECGKPMKNIIKRWIRQYGLDRYNDILRQMGYSHRVSHAGVAGLQKRKGSEYVEARRHRVVDAQEVPEPCRRCVWRDPGTRYCMCTECMKGVCYWQVEYRAADGKRRILDLHGGARRFPTRAAACRFAAARGFAVTLLVRVFR